MASDRLRRRIANHDVQSNVTESFVTIGTPLPSLGSNSYDANEYKPIWEQEVRDEQGRRRFHGAFTGGFSAGYFNTVGSKEGWKPTTFRSSRTEKLAASGGGEKAKPMSKPEDFMDEEDLAELREERQIQSSNRYSDSAVGTSAPIGRDPLSGAGEGEPLAAAFLDSLVRPKHSSVGTMMLKRMGWKEGHGLGPLITAKRRRELLALSRPSTSKVTLDDLEGEADGEDADHLPMLARTGKRQLYPPPDTPLNTMLNKENRHGLGYSAGSKGMDDVLRRVYRERRALRHGEDPIPGGPGTRGGANLKPTGLGGLGNASDEEDMDAFMGSVEGDIEDWAFGHSQFRDHERGRENRLLLGQVSRKDAGSVAHACAQGSAEMADDYATRWRDGRPLPPGFRRAAQVQMPDKRFQPLPVSPDWQPDQRRVLAIISNESAKASETAAAETYANMKPEDRARILGEARIPGPAPSLSDYISSKAQEALQRSRETGDNAAVAAPLLVASAQSAVQPFAPKLTIPPLDPSTALAAIRGYMPFGADLSKQARYRAYLKSQAFPTDASVQLDSAAVIAETQMSVEQVNRELDEFVKSAAIFRPMNAAMANRFRSADSASSAKEFESPKPGLYQPPPAASSAPSSSTGNAAEAEARKAIEERLREEERQARTPAQNAARAGVFGKMTRSVEEWVPSRLLCKRFNVPDPHPDRTGREAATGGADAGAGAGDNAEEEQRPPPRRRKDPFALTTDADDLPRGSATVTWEANKRSIQAMAKERAWLQGQPSPFLDASSSLAGGADTGSSGTPAGGARITSTPLASDGGGGVPPSLDQVGLGDDPTQGRDTLTYQKPSIDIFKAIFASDEEDSDEEEGQNTGVDAKAEVEGASQAKTAPTTDKSIATLLQRDRVGDIADGTPLLIRPTFIAKSQREAAGKALVADVEVGAEAAGRIDAKKRRKDKDKQKDKTKKGKSGCHTLSFGMEEDDGGEEEFSPAFRITSRPKASDLF
ncbi:hypothetical protein K437DRAFT_254300 [Tilletiaria anomala UBC 951]|uniref:G-patch domain-containing protein n=1 Tax=Tilletiaria anomala (strain ATCC 24038 / CBS 436.72 / UBC 951) TaxID=1037660 RepID=A0A066WEY8_TILAU|nr:uncharacterized protein K437DRAFT_254300 [Tilletiaria anomala UBC 951]KDN52316.1 hypothetical protein K437DRAFT_254300 [Tilletiaria anomala UBC 951]